MLPVTGSFRLKAVLDWKSGQSRYSTHTGRYSGLYVPGRRGRRVLTECINESALNTLSSSQSALTADNNLTLLHLLPPFLCLPGCINLDPPLPFLTQFACPTLPATPLKWSPSHPTPLDPLPAPPQFHPTLHRCSESPCVPETCSRCSKKYASVLAVGISGHVVAKCGRVMRMKS